MPAIAQCPRCTQLVMAPDERAAELTARCPICGGIFSLSEVQPLLAPPLIILPRTAGIDDAQRDTVWGKGATPFSPPVSEIPSAERTTAVAESEKPLPATEIITAEVVVEAKATEDAVQPLVVQVAQPLSPTVATEQFSPRITTEVVPAVIANEVVPTVAAGKGAPAAITAEMVVADTEAAARGVSELSIVEPSAAEPVLPDVLPMVVDEALPAPVSAPATSEPLEPAVTVSVGPQAAEATVESFDAAAFAAISASAAEEAEGAEGQPAKPFRRQEKNPVKEMIGIVLGGIAGLAIGYYLLNFFSNGKHNFLNVWLPFVPGTYQSGSAPELDTGGQGGGKERGSGRNARESGEKAGRPGKGGPSSREGGPKNLPTEIQPFEIPPTPPAPPPSPAIPATKPNVGKQALAK